MLKFVISSLENVYAMKAMVDYAVISVFQLTTITQIVSNVIVQLLGVFHLRVIRLENVHALTILLENNVLNAALDITTTHNVYVCCMKPKSLHGSFNILF